MKRVLIAGLALALSAGAATARAPQSPALNKAYRDDVTCAVLYMAIAAKGEDQASAALGFYYFIGRLEGRRPDVDWRTHVIAAAETAGQDTLEENGQRCGNMLIENGQNMGPIDQLIERWSAGEGRMGAALAAQRGEQPQGPTSGW